MSEIVNRPQLRACVHPKQRSKCDKAWRVWVGRYFLGTVYQLHPKGMWYAVDPTGTTVRSNGENETFSSSNGAVQRLQGIFEQYKPRKDPKSEAKSPYLRYPHNELPPSD